jgi:hypothetical protein
MRSNVSKNVICSIRKTYAAMHVGSGRRAFWMRINADKRGFADRERGKVIYFIRENPRWSASKISFTIKNQGE